MNIYLKRFLLWFFFAGILTFFLFVISDFIEGYSSLFRALIYLDFIGFIMCSGMCSDFGTIIYFFSTPLSLGIIAGLVSIIYTKFKVKNQEYSYREASSYSSKYILILIMQIVLACIFLIIFKESITTIAALLIIIYTLIFIKGVRWLRMIESIIALPIAFFFSSIIFPSFVFKIIFFVLSIIVSIYLFYFGLREK